MNTMRQNAAAGHSHRSDVFGEGHDFEGEAPLLRGLCRRRFEWCGSRWKVRNTEQPDFLFSISSTWRNIHPGVEVR